MRPVENYPLLGKKNYQIWMSDDSIEQDHYSRILFLYTERIFGNKFA